MTAPMIDFLKGLSRKLVRGLSVVAWILGGISLSAWGQSASPSPASPVSPPPSASATPAAGVAPPSLEDRLRRMEEAYHRMEAANQKIQQQYEALQRKYDSLSREMDSNRDTNPGRASPATTRPVSRVEAAEYQNPPDTSAGEGLGAEGMGGRTAPRTGSSLGARGTDGRDRVPGEGGETLFGPPAGSPDQAGDGTGSGLSQRARRGIGAQGTEGRVYHPETSHRGDEKVPRRPARVVFAEGLEFSSPDEEFKLTFHNLTQVDFRSFPSEQEGILRSQVYIPRQRWYFTGRVTRNVEYYTSINHGYGSLDLLDAFITYRIDERLRFRAGRMKTPYLYEYFSIAAGELIAPERSIYAQNMATNRQFGAMALGELFEGRVGYAIGGFSGPRRSFEDTNSAKDVIGYFNSRPLLKSARFSALNYMNIGGTFDVGYQDEPALPQALRTANQLTNSSGANSLSPTFLALNNNVIELGKRAMWSGHLAWFYKSFMFLGEYGGGNAGYSTTHGKYPTSIPFDGYSFQAAYFLTGEQLTRRVNVVKPRRNFSLARGKFGPGAVEVFGRYSDFQFGKEVFAAGFADPNLYSNHAWATDIGVNWYLNFYTRVYIDWQHSEFGSPVVIAPGRSGPTRDLFWVRLQVFF